MRMPLMKVLAMYAGMFSQPPETLIMRSFAIKKTQTPYQRLSTDAPFSEFPNNWKLNLALKFRRNQRERSPRLESLIGNYIKSDVEGQEKYLFLGSLVRACMEDGEDLILHDILENENVESLKIQGPVGDHGWETFAKAMPDNLAVKKLSLRDLRVSTSEAEHLFHILGRAHALRKLTLEQISVESSFFSNFSSLKCPRLEVESLTVFAGYPARMDDDDCSLPRKVLEACSGKLLSFTFEERGGTTVDEHAAIGKALAEQVNLQSLRLKSVLSKDVLFCYMPFLSKMTPLAVLDLSGFSFGTALLEVLTHSKRELKSLSLIDGSPQGGGGGDYRYQFRYFADMPRLETLDLTHSWIDDDTVVPLLFMIEKGMIGPLRHLCLNDNLFGRRTMEALASLLEENRTLRTVEMRTSEPQDAEVLDKLEKAIEHNTSLLQFTLGQPNSSLHTRVEPYLDRNRQAFDAMTASALHGIDLTDHGLPEVIVHNESADLTERAPLLNNETQPLNYGSFQRRRL